MRNCRQCGEPIGLEKRKDSRFCSNSCKAKYHEQKNGKKESGGDLGNIRPEPKRQIEHSEIKHNAEHEALEPFKNILNGGDKPLTETPKSDVALIQIKPLPPQQITKQLSLPNPKYDAAKKQLDECRVLMQNNLNALTWLNEQIRIEKNKDGTGIYLTGGITGAALGYWVMGDNSPGQNKRKPAENTKKIVGSVALGLLGLYVGNLVNSEAEPIREKQKIENIKKYKQQILIHEEYLRKLRPHEEKLVFELFKYKPTLTQTQTILNPAYDEVLKHNVLIEQKSHEETNMPSVLEGVEKKKTETKNPLETDKILSAKNMASQQIPLLDFRDKWFDFLGKPQTNFFLVVHGKSGEGKTHFTIQFAKYLAERFGNVLYVSGEEGFAPTMQKKIQDLGAMVPKLYVGDFRTGTELLTEVPNKYHFIIIDSINNMDIQPELMKAIRQRFKQSAFIAVCQSTKDDKIRGSYQIVHDSDITLKVNNGIAVTTKNRFKQKGTEFDAFAALKKQSTKVIRIKPDDKFDEDFRNTVNLL